MNKWIKIGLIVIPVVMLAACGTFGSKKQQGGGAPVQGGQAQPPESATTMPVAPGGGAEAVPLPGGGSAQQEQAAPAGAPADLMAKRVVYFDLDSSSVHDEDHAIVQAHANYLAQHPAVKVTLEGHADERGSREYNIGLGERRAAAVKQMMALLGVSAQQISSVSYGEERPAATGHDESAWHLNRRVEIVYTAQ